MPRDRVSQGEVARAAFGGVACFTTVTSKYTAATRESKRPSGPVSCLQLLPGLEKAAIVKPRTASLSPIPTCPAPNTVSACIKATKTFATVSTRQPGAINDFQYVPTPCAVHFPHHLFLEVLAIAFRKHMIWAGNDGCNELYYTGIRSILPEGKTPVGIKSCQPYLDAYIYDSGHTCMPLMTL